MGSAEDTATSSDRSPADVDWPRGFGESSWWPIVTAIGVMGIYAGAGLLLLSRRTPTLVSPVLGAVVAVGAVLVFLGGLFGWNYHGFVLDFWRHEHPGTRNRFRWGMVLFLCSEVMTFGSGFAFYFYLRVGPWPPGPLPEVLSSLVAVNTAVLVASSATMHVAHGALREGNRRRFVGLLATTVALGVVFLCGQAYEYYDFVVNKGFTISQGIFGSAFFGLTGLHGLHVALGVTLLSILLVRAWSGQYSSDRHVSVTTVTMYWHFVDAVWICLVAALYVGATVTL